ncbi:MAG: hypothetical protein RBT46_04935 [Weeksellaceae bacterium]|jgi:dsDNA-specific endonuclease/ATPase MutS2|nr:hypothetical protein [Weeksellaceae bacterium]
MKFKIGDEIKVLDDDQKGKIIQIQGNKIVILTEYGFEETYSVTEIIPDTDFFIDDFLSVPKTEESILPKTITKSKKENDVKEIDLHFDSLVDYPSRYEPFEKLNIQLNKAKEEIELARTEKRKKIILIHGHGSGKLKYELMKLLKKYSNIQVYDASFQKFNGGASVVEFG